VSDLKKYLPERLLSLPVRDFLDAFQPEIDALAAACEGIRENELFAMTASEWLPLWEKAYGLPVEPEKNISFRRSRLVSKVRGAGTTTKEMIRQVVSSFAQSDCEVIEFPAEYRFEVHFVDRIGIPPNMDDVTAALEEIKPAHLAYQIVYLFHTWSRYAEVTWNDAKKMTWAEMKG